MLRLILHPSLRSTHPNIAKIAVMQMAENVQFLTPVFALFVVRQGLAIDAFFLLMAIYNGSWLALEVPSGYASDRLGRKVTLIIGSIGNFLGTALLLVSHDFWQFAAAFFLLAIGSSFESGTMEAMVHESLHERNEEGHSREILRRIFAASFTAQAIGAIAGGLLASIDLSWPVIATLPFMGLHLILALSLREPTEHGAEEAKREETLLPIVGRTLTENSPVRALIAVYAVISTMTLCLFWASQPYQERSMLPLALFGVFHAVAQYMNAWISKRMIGIEKRVSDTAILIGTAVLITLCCLILSTRISLILLPFLLLGRGLFGVIHPFTSDVINTLTPKASRATVLSVRQFAAKALFAVVSPGFGLLAAHSLHSALFALGIGGGVLLVLGLILWSRSGHRLTVS
jgi:hypothetical protein